MFSTLAVPEPEIFDPYDGSRSFHMSPSGLHTLSLFSRRRARCTPRASGVSEVDGRAENEEQCFRPRFLFLYYGREKKGTACSLESRRGCQVSRCCHNMSSFCHQIEQLCGWWRHCRVVFGSATCRRAHEPNVAQTPLGSPISDHAVGVQWSLRSDFNHGGRRERSSEDLCRQFEL